MLVEIESRFEQYNETDHQQERTAEVNSHCKRWLFCVLYF